jgi:hypothetical protein
MHGGNSTQIHHARHSYIIDFMKDDTISHLLTNTRCVRHLQVTPKHAHQVPMENITAHGSDTTKGDQ